MDQRLSFANFLRHPICVVIKSLSTHFPEPDYFIRWTAANIHPGLCPIGSFQLSNIYANVRSPSVNCVDLLVSIVIFQRLKENSEIEVCTSVFVFILYKIYFEQYSTFQIFQTFVCIQTCSFTIPIRS